MYYGDWEKGHLEIYSTSFRGMIFSSAISVDSTRKLDHIPYLCDILNAMYNQRIETLRPGQNGGCTEDISKYVLLNGNDNILIQGRHGGQIDPGNCLAPKSHRRSDNNVLITWTILCHYGTLS